MNDLEFLSAQVKRIKSDIAVAKRMDWMRRGIGIYAKRQTVAQKQAALRAGNTANNRCRLKSHKTKTFQWSSPAMGA